MMLKKKRMDWWFKITIQKRIFLSMMILIVVFLSIALGIIYSSFVEVYKRNEVENAISSAVKTKHNLEIILAQVRDMGDYLADSEEVREIVEGIYNDTKDYSYEYEIADMLRKFDDAHIYFDNLYIATSNRIFDAETIQVGEQALFDRIGLVAEEGSYYDAVDPEGELIFNDQGSSVFYIMPIKGYESDQASGLIVIELNYVYLRETFTAASFQSLEKVMVVNEDQNVIFTFPFYTDLSELIDQHPELLTESMQFEDQVFGEESIIVSDRIEYSDWSMVRVISTKNIYEENGLLSEITLIVLLVMIVVTLGVSYYLSVFLTRPITELNETMKEVEKGDFSVKVNTVRHDEIGELGKTFNVMVGEIQKLINKTLDQQKKKADMEFQILQAQINPHFLYNTLNSIRWLAVIQKADNISDMTTAIINLLKYNISQNNVLVTLEEEVESIRNYIKIQKYRFGDNFEVTYAIESVASYRTLKFILQPIVENAIIHGFKDYKYGGLIHISGQSDGQSLVIVIADNGVGFDGSSIKGTSEEDEKRMHKGIGIDNIEERIKLYFGEDYGVSLSEVEQGTQVVITMPLITKDESNFA